MYPWIHYKRPNHSIQYTHTAHTKQIHKEGCNFNIFMGVLDVLPIENEIYNQRIGQCDLFFVVSCPAKSHCTAVSALQNGRFSRLRGLSHSPCPPLSFFPLHNINKKTHTQTPLSSRLCTVLKRYFELTRR